MIIKILHFKTCERYSKSGTQREINTQNINIRKENREARKTTILQPVDQKPQLQKDREDEKAEGYVPDEGTRKNPRKTTK